MPTQIVVRASDARFWEVRLRAEQTFKRQTCVHYRRWSVTIAAAVAVVCLQNAAVPTINAKVTKCGHRTTCRRRRYTPLRVDLPAFP
jgi:uncharacterized membrane protein YdfJ with MMPL/SSD domain